MKWLRGWLVRFAGLFRKERREREFADEMESQLQMHIEDNLRAGMSAEEARREALMKLGGVEQTKEMVRERRGLPCLKHCFRTYATPAACCVKVRASLLSPYSLLLSASAQTQLFSPS